MEDGGGAVAGVNETCQGFSGMLLCPLLGLDFMHVDKCRKTGNDADSLWWRNIARTKFVTETICLVANFAVLFVFVYFLCWKHIPSDEYQHTHTRIRSPRSLRSPRSPRTPGRNRSPGCRTESCLLIGLPLSLLIVGAVFGIAQGLLENIVLHDCAQLHNTHFEFALYVSHRALLLLIYVHRLYVCFGPQQMGAGYPTCFFVVVLFMIAVSAIFSFVSLWNSKINKIPTEWRLHLPGRQSRELYICAWQFGGCALFFARNFDFLLNIVMLSAFLRKLVPHIRRTPMPPTPTPTRTPTLSPRRTPHNNYGRVISNLSNLSHSQFEFNDDEEEIERDEFESESSAHFTRREQLVITVRRMTVLTFVATLSSIIVTGGYFDADVRIMGVFWSFDILLNSCCCILMFKWTNAIIYPCVGKRWNRCCGIKCMDCCACCCCVFSIVVSCLRVRVRARTRAERAFSTATDANTNGEEKEEVHLHGDIGHNRITASSTIIAVAPPVHQPHSESHPIVQLQLTTV